MSTHEIVEQSKVVMHYRITLEDGTVADSTWEDNAPIAFALGDGTLSPGLEQALHGLKAGDHETLTLSPEQGFGYKDTENIHNLPRDDFDPEMPLEPGMVIGFSLPSGEELPGMVMDVTESHVQVDFNHPFSGHQLKFEVEVISVEN
ncbi:MAG TPA: FKBP-type peptidyl-prolyl cis-trans isomerase [Gammaproteobacteria bacterium]